MEHQAQAWKANSLIQITGPAFISCLILNPPMNLSVALICHGENGSIQSGWLPGPHWWSRGSAWPPSAPCCPNLCPVNWRNAPINTSWRCVYSPNGLWRNPFTFSVAASAFVIPNPSHRIWCDLSCVCLHSEFRLTFLFKVWLPTSYLSQVVEFLRTHS